ncbi:MAG: hypothetical protein IJ834_04800 [Paludibacteraceae bacterium]|nr:hypothetical protein [Paludibacteraceae bacterium]
MKRISFLVLCLVCALCVGAQNSYEEFRRQQQAAYNNYRKQAQEEWEAYREKANKEFANYMKTAWQKADRQAPIPMPEKPEPIVQPKKEDTEEPTIPQEVKVIPPAPAPEPYVKPEPVIPVEKTEKSKSPATMFLFYDTPCSVHFDKSMKFTVADATEASASAAWEKLATKSYDALLADCIGLRDRMHLSDWGYIRMLQVMTESFLGNKNEAILLQMYLLTQSGYRVRIARTDERWVLLVPFTTDIYNYSFIQKGGVKYYVIDKAEGRRQFFVFDREFPNEKTASVRMSQAPVLAQSATRPRTLQSKKYPEIKLTLAENQNLIDFYNDYPVSSDWNYYSNASISPDVKKTLYATLKPLLQGKDKKTAANMLLNFVQTAFEYKTDQQQFGYERPLFADETLYYPFCDCEDRSIFYSILVKELLDLDVVLLNYPEHLATAVCFPDGQAYGSFLNYNKKKYTVCDPTYIGSSVGDCMPQYKTTQPTIVKID